MGEWVVGGVWNGGPLGTQRAPGDCTAVIGALAFPCVLRSPTRRSFLNVSVEWRDLYDAFQRACAAQSKNHEGSFPRHGGGDWVVPADDLLITSICLLPQVSAFPCALVLTRIVIPLLIAANFAGKVVHVRDLGFTPRTGHKRCFKTHHGL